MVEFPILHPEFFLRYHLNPPKGLLLYGPPGTGKTLVARCLAKLNIANFYTVNGPELTSRYVGESEEKLRQVFLKAIATAPSIIFLDEVDSLCPSRDDNPDQQEQRMVACLLTLMDTISPRDRVVVIGATHRPSAIDAAMRRSGRFDREIELTIPTLTERRGILGVVFGPAVQHSLSSTDLDYVASITHGYVGADLAAVAQEAGVACVKRLDSVLTTLHNANESTSRLQELKISIEDVQQALKMVRPSAMREISLEVPTVRWSDIGGQEEIKKRLQEAVEWPLTHPEAFEALGIDPPKGILLYGPPGCSKTLLAKALATESSRNFIAVKGPELFSKYLGDSEKAVREVFRKARAASPSIIFLDELDSMAGIRGSSGDSTSSVEDRVVSQLLVELDGINPLKQVTIVGATNRPDLIDKALLRPGRIDRILYVSPPDAAAATAIFEIELKKMAHDEALVDTKALGATASEKLLSGAEITNICREAALLAMEESEDAMRVEARHLDQALAAATSRITQEMRDFYFLFQQSSGLVSL
eukprot:g54896.t1